MGARRLEFCSGCYQGNETESLSYGWGEVKEYRILTEMGMGLKE
jgi:hypothetical protein